MPQEPFQPNAEARKYLALIDEYVEGIRRFGYSDDSKKNRQLLQIVLQTLFRGAIASGTKDGINLAKFSKE